jgi:hypothetical protein
LLQISQSVLSFTGCLHVSRYDFSWIFDNFQIELFIPILPST